MATKKKGWWATYQENRTKRTKARATEKTKRTEARTDRVEARTDSRTARAEERTERSKERTTRAKGRQEARVATADERKELTEHIYDKVHSAASEVGSGVLEAFGIDAKSESDIALEQQQAAAAAEAAKAAAAASAGKGSSGSGGSKTLLFGLLGATVLGGLALTMGGKKGGKS